MKLRYLLVAILALFSTVLIADHEVLRSEFETIDKNFDGYINLQEAMTSSFLLSNWEEIDVNSDQHIDVVEFIEFDVATLFIPPANEHVLDVGAAIP